MANNVGTRQWTPLGRHHINNEILFFSRTEQKLFNLGLYFYLLEPQLCLICPQKYSLIVWVVVKLTLPDSDTIHLLLPVEVHHTFSFFFFLFFKQCVLWTDLTSNARQKIQTGWGDYQLPKSDEISSCGSKENKTMWGIPHMPNKSRMTGLFRIPFKLEFWWQSIGTLRKTVHHTWNDITSET